VRRALEQAGARRPVEALSEAIGLPGRSSSLPRRVFRLEADGLTDLRPARRTSRRSRSETNQRLTIALTTADQRTLVVLTGPAGHPHAILGRRADAPARVATSSAGPDIGRDLRAFLAQAERSMRAMDAVESVSPAPERTIRSSVGRGWPTSAPPAARSYGWWTPRSTMR